MLQNIDCVLSVIKHNSQMFLYLHLKLVLYNMKVNCRIHTANLKVEFLLFRMTLNRKLKKESMTSQERDCRRKGTPF